jgi:hypothetical protein
LTPEYRVGHSLQVAVAATDELLKLPTHVDPVITFAHG